MSRQNSKNLSTNKWAPAQNATKYILCHVRKVSNRKDTDEDEEEGGPIDLGVEQDNDVLR